MSKKQWQAIGVLFSVIALACWSVWPVQAGISTKINASDNMSGNISEVVYADGDDWSDGTSGHVLMGVLYQSSPQTIADGKTGPAQGDANGRALVVDAAGNTLLGTIDADTGAIKTAIELIDHLTASNSGSKDANTQRVVLATDDIPTALVNANLDDLMAVTEGRAIAASGQHLDNAGGGTAADTDYSVTVVALATYRVHAVNGVIYLGILDPTTDANAIWSVGASEKIEITIPSGTALHYFVDTAGVEGRLARIQ